MKIMVFTEGTLLNKDLPTNSSVDKLKMWSKKEKILYITSRKENEIVELKKLMSKYGFPDGEIFFRKIDYETVEDYIDVINRVKPDVVIDNTCESIGFFNTIEPRLDKNSKTKAITVKEFSGLKDLPDDTKKLKSFDGEIETHKMPWGRIFVIKNLSKRSAGFLELNEGESLEDHTTPVNEILRQISGECIISIGDDEELMTPGEEFKIPAGRVHSHSNSTGETSLTLWMLDGDVAKGISMLITHK